MTKPFNFNIDEDVVLDGDKLNFATSAGELAERGRKKLKFMTLERYADLLDVREKK
ncbi:MAG: hypothetical protein WDO16_15780 [Bacteroidota bacterium]